MKHEIQRQIAEETEGMTNEEKRRWTRDTIASDPVLGPWWARLRKVKGTGLIARKGPPVKARRGQRLTASE